MFAKTISYFSLCEKMSQINFKEVESGLKLIEIKQGQNGIKLKFPKERREHQDVENIDY